VIPSDVASFVACHEARDFVGVLSNGDPATRLLGKYGSPDGQVQADGGKKPLFISSGAGGFPCLRFDDVDDILYLDTATALAGPLTVFHVYAPRGNTNGNWRALRGDPGYNSGWGGSWRLLHTQHPSLGGVYQANAYPTGGNELNVTGYTLPDRMRIHCVQMNTPFSTGLKYRIDNALKGTSGDATGPGTLSLGGTDGPAYMDWVATITFDAELGASDRDGIYDYIIDEVLGLGNQLQFTQDALETVGTGTDELQFSQHIIEYLRVRAPQPPFFHAQVIG
jgi:hypothetical protein